MKKLLNRLAAAGLILAVSICPAAAVTWLGANQATIAWEAVTTLSDGTPLPAGDALSYRVFTKMLPSAAEVVAGDTTQTQYTLTFSAEGRYVVGIQAIRVPAGTTSEQKSPITWSDSTDVVAVPDPFGIEYFVSPSAIKGLTAE